MSAPVSRRWRSAIVILPRWIRAAAALSFAGFATSELAAAPAGLLPEPWPDGERLVFSLREHGKDTIAGYAVSSIEAAGEADHARWQINFRVWLGRSALSLVEVDQNTFLPLHSLYRSPALGEITADFEGGGVAIEQRQDQQRGQLRRWEQTLTIYLSLYLMRRFPLEEGFATELFLVNARKPLDQTPTVMSLTEFDRIRTATGPTETYRVDARMDDSRRSFWLGTDDRRLLYRVEEPGGLNLSLLRAELPSPDGQRKYRDPESDFVLTMPDDWLAFPDPSSAAHPTQQRVVFLLPEAQGEFSMTRHPRFGEIDAVATGSLRWLEGNKRAFSLQTPEPESVTGAQWEARLFRGTYDENGEAHGLFHAILAHGEHLYLFTGNAPAGVFDALAAEFRRIAVSIAWEPPAPAEADK